MSRCIACNEPLTDREAKRRSHKTGEELGLCDHCLRPVLEVQNIVIDDGVDSTELLLEPEDDLDGLFDYRREEDE